MKKKLVILLIAVSLVVTVSSCDKLKSLFKGKAKVEEPGNVLILTDIPEGLLKAGSVTINDSDLYVIQAVLTERLDGELKNTVFGVVDNYDAENREFHFNLFEEEKARPWRGNGEYYITVTFIENDKDQKFSYSDNPVKNAYSMGYAERYWADLEEIKFNTVSFSEQTTRVSFDGFDDMTYGKYD